MLRSVLLLLLIWGTASAIEPWADKKLSFADGLELWLDARTAFGKDNPSIDGKLARWADGSGKNRHLIQSNAALQPHRIPVGDTAIVRFDGHDDCLRAVNQNAELKSFTLFLVAAPRANPGPFRGLIAFNAKGQRDYESGFNLDLGPQATPQFSSVNVEGRGFGGAKNLRTKTGLFGQLSFLEVVADEKNVQLIVNGVGEGSRPRTASTLSLDEITLGARFYNNGPGEQSAAGFARCDIAEALIFNRALSVDETKKIRDYLNAKHETLKRNLPPESGEVLVPVKDPPSVQVLLPGFTVKELPVALTNINNIKYRPDGTLVALAYNGNIWNLKDSDGDGLPDKSDLVYENKGSLISPIGMDLTPPNYKHGTGVFVAAKGKCVLIADTDGDGKADKETIVAGGWKEESVNIDVVGVAVDPKDQSIWFGRGTPNYTNGYLVDKDGKAQYSLKDERGTIQRVAPDFSSREIIATGLRFTVGLRFNRAGDLFATDQEGATWLPNGNPFDELLHIQKGRHYGFPPRHPKHLPNVIDEPSVFDYGPQHQSTCGLCFNEPVTDGGPTFGPKWWSGDAFVTGYSRGKLWRTKLVKTEHGYVTKSDLFACLSMLTADVCVSPDGSLIVACHSGGPDWGSGPTGKGKLFKISYTAQDLPQPVLTWPSSPREIRVAFDREIDPVLLKDALSQTKLTAGEFVRAGDRFESLWPGYAVVQAEKAAARINVPVRSLNLTPDRRTLVLAVDPLNASHFALTLPGLGRAGHHAQTDLGFDLSGSEATWKGRDGSNWIGWLPSMDLEVAKQITFGSADHDAIWKLSKNYGSLTLNSRIPRNGYLRPAVQTGSRIDVELPRERPQVAFNGSKKNWISPAYVELPGTNPDSYIDWRANFQLESPGESGPTLQVTFKTDEDNRSRPLHINRFNLPWSKPIKSTSEMRLIKPSELTGGSWARGRKLFFSEPANCSKCHTVSGQGSSIGPDLSNLVHRDYTSVLRDIEQPSFALNPDHLTYSILLKDGRTLAGAIHTNGEKVQVGDVKGVITEINNGDIESMKPTPLSTMPDDLAKQLGAEKMKDLLTFLLTNPVSMPRDYPGPGPKPRSIAEVNAMLSGAPKDLKIRPIRIVLVAGPKDHGPGEHDYPAWQKAWSELLAASENVDIATAWEWPAKEEFAKADAMIFFQRGDWNAARAADIDAFLERGGGLTYIHWAVDGRADGPGFAKRIGMAAKGGAVGFRHGDLTLDLNKAAKHPILRNFDKLALKDETYWKMFGELKQHELLATAVEEGQPRPQVWAVERGKGRVFVSIPGHYSWTFDDPLFRILLLRGVAWAAKEPVDRFNDLVWPGAIIVK